MVMDVTLDSIVIILQYTQISNHSVAKISYLIGQLYLHKIGGQLYLQLYLYWSIIPP